jgi:CubicO group peptidase (beta-lactamase class C family)
MSDSQPSAEDLGLMCGFPPPVDKRVTHRDQLLAPFNRWSFQNELRLNRTADVWRGDGPVAPLQYQPRDLSGVTYRNRAGTQFSFDDMVEMSYTDGIIVLHDGKVIHERYLNGMKPQTLHAWASCSKSVTGVLAAMLAHEGIIDPARRVGEYLPELQASGFDDATVQQVMDMTTAIAFATPGVDPISENLEYSIVMGWRSPTSPHGEIGSSYDFLATMRKEGEHGTRFSYLTPNTDVLAWIIKRQLNQSLAEAMSHRIWTTLGAERDAFWIVDPSASETAGSGLLTTLRDMARFGQMLLQNGKYNGVQIVPEGVVEEIKRGGNQEAFARGPAARPMNQNYSYRHQWWITHNAHGAYMGLGYGGQILYIDPKARLVAAKFSSYPTPTPAGNEFYSAMAAFPALAQFLLAE